MRQWEQGTRRAREIGFVCEIPAESTFKPRLVAVIVVPVIVVSVPLRRLARTQLTPYES